MVTKNDIALLRNFTILYVEDDKNIIDTMKGLLSSYFKEVFTAQNGKDGIEEYKKYKPDIVLSDINMPKMNGVEMSKKIKEMNSFQNIALFTAFNEITHLRDAVNIGISKYILKPLDEEQFFDAMVSIVKVLQLEIEKDRMQHLLATQSKIASLGEMLGNIAHQWRQPLSVISTVASGLKLQKENNIKVEEEIEILDSIIVQTKYLSETIDDFRGFFSNDQNSKIQFNIMNGIKKVIKLTNDAYKTNFIKVVLNFSEEEIFLKQNENQLVQALLNIFNNAKDAFVLNDIKGKRYFFIDIENHENYVKIFLKDNAGGMPEDVKDKIFEPYFTTKHKSIGTGIGLYMTNVIFTKNFSGTIFVENTTYEYNNETFTGAMFKIVIPKT